MTRSGVALLGLLALTATAPLPALAEGMAEAAVNQVLADPRVARALEAIKADDARTLAEQRRLTEIPAPPFKEAARGVYLLSRFKEVGFADASMDSEGNVLARLKGSGGGPMLVIAAHQDTVFPEGTDVTVRENDGVLNAPGIGDDSRGLAALLSVMQAIKTAELSTVGDVLFVADVGEEELGNLRGMKALFRDYPKIDGFVSIDGLGLTRIINRGTGSHRYEMVFRGPGGHSFQEFGLPSATHALGRAAAKIAELRVPAEPRTTFTVGTVSGGTSVNAIAAEARMTVDMRSNSTEELLKLEQRLLGLVHEAVADENRRWDTDKMTVEVKLIGDRPAGETPADSPLVEAAQRSARALTGAARVGLSGASTDSNVPMSLGIPAITIGGGGEGGNWHSRNEWYKPARAWLGPQNALVLVLALTGLDGATAPVLARRK